MNIDSILAEANKRHSLRGKTIGQDITLPEVAHALFQAFIDETREEIEERMAANESKNFKELGKLALLNKLEKKLGTEASE